MNKEIRYSPAKLEFRNEETPKIVGYAALFNSLSEDLGGFVERIRAGAFTDTLATGPDVRALIDHNPSLIVARSKAGTLALTQDDTGLRIEITPPNTTVAQDLLENLRLGNLDQMSFAFTTNEDQWSMEDGRTVRELVSVNLLDVSIVTYPAYPDTSVAVRSLGNIHRFDPSRLATLKRKLIASQF